MRRRAVERSNGGACSAIETADCAKQDACLVGGANAGAAKRATASATNGACGASADCCSLWQCCLHSSDAAIASSAGQQAIAGRISSVPLGLPMHANALIMPFANKVTNSATTAKRRRKVRENMRLAYGKLNETASMLRHVTYQH